MTATAGASGSLCGRGWVLAGSLCGLTGVAAGAFGAHVLEGTLDASSLATWEVAVRYQLVHAVCILFVGLLERVSEARKPAVGVSFAGWMFFTGIILFSGSLYVLSLTGWRAFGAITPVGGLAFLAGWASLGWSAWRSNARM